MTERIAVVIEEVDLGREKDKTVKEIEMIVSETKTLGTKIEKTDLGIGIVVVDFQRGMIVTEMIDFLKTGSVTTGLETERGIMKGKGTMTEIKWIDLMIEEIQSVKRTTTSENVLGEIERIKK